MNLCFTTLHVQDMEKTGKLLDKVLGSIGIERVAEFHTDDNGTKAGTWYMYAAPGEEFCFAIGNAVDCSTLDQPLPELDVFFRVKSREAVDAFAKAAKEAGMVERDESKPCNLSYIGGTNYSCGFKDPNNAYYIGVTYHVSRLHDRDLDYGNNFTGKLVMTSKYSVPNAEK